MKRWLASLLLVVLGAWEGGIRHDAARARGGDAARGVVLGTRAACAAYEGLPAGWGVDPRAGMVWIAGGRFVPGSQEGYADERPSVPAAEVEVAGFWMDRTEVTNAQFATFVAATRYVTRAEREGSSAVFDAPSEQELAERPLAWWRREAGADWRHPEGRTSDLRGRESQPVVHIAHEDALAYARWLGRALPSEDQWEYAARAGRSDDALHRAPVSPTGVALANFWQGAFPTQNDAADGFVARAPVGCYPANPFGLHDTIGNVWEWTRDLYRTRAEADRRAHTGTEASCEGQSARAARASEGAPRVIKGGSFLCAADFCARYRVAARHPHEPNTTTAHVGFRTVRAAR